MTVSPDLVVGVELLCLDAGNTIIFLDHARVAEICKIHGFDVTASALIQSEGEAKRRAEGGATGAAGESGTMIDVPFSFKEKPGARSWGKMIATMLSCAGARAEDLTRLVDALWREHESFNLWRLVPDGFVEAASAYREIGGKIAVVSNSEGMLQSLFARLGVLASFDAVVDSGLVGVEKPDPRIFDFARERTGGIAKEHALHLGDMFATDVLGARAAGIRHALIDPHGHYESRHVDVPRVPGAVEVMRALASRT